MRVLILLISLSLSLPVYAAVDYDPANFYDGNKLLTDCREHSKWEAGREYIGVRSSACRAYIVSASDAHDAYVGWKFMSPHFCLLDGVTQGQLTSVVIKYLEANPEKLHHVAGGLVVNALRRAFPCTE